MNTEDKIIQKLLEIDEKMATKSRVDDLDKKVEGIMDGMDKQMVILKRLDQERIFTQEWIRRIEDEVKTHSQELSRIKLQLKIA